MRFRFLDFHILLAVVIVTSGCVTWKSPNKVGSYETVTANPTYDTKKAQRQHAKALGILDSYFAGKAGDLAAAEDHLQKALTADVTFGPAHNTLGIVYMLQRKYYLAAWEFEYAAKSMPDNIEPVYNLGRLYEDADKLDCAIECYEKVLSMSPRDHTAIASLASCQLRNGQTLDEVRPMLESIVFGDNRREWVEWAQDLMGRKPIEFISSSTPAETPSPPTPATNLKLVPNDAKSLKNDPDQPASPSNTLDSDKQRGDDDADKPPEKQIPDPPLPGLPGRATVN